MGLLPAFALSAAVGGVTRLIREREEIDGLYAQLQISEALRTSESYTWALGCARSCACFQREWIPQLVLWS